MFLATNSHLLFTIGELEVLIMKKEFLYRYVSFETFVGMVQNSALTFVLPSVWEDPYEAKPFYTLIKNTDDIVKKLFLLSIFHKTYCQSWTTLAESDAMWRIYSYNCRALRISVCKDKIKLLENIDVIPIRYEDNFDTSSTENNYDKFIDSLAKKRSAFEHEQEIRLISCFKFKDTDDAERHIKAWLGISGNPDAIDFVENLFPSLVPDEQATKICELLNIGANARTTKDISFKHISNFIDGVMVHPQAPDWYCKIVKDFCTINGVNYEGKSKLYSNSVDL